MLGTSFLPVFDATFWQNFWPNFFADLIVGVFITGVIGWVIKVHQRVDIGMNAKIRDVEDGGAIAQFGVVNKGNTSIKPDEISYHVFVPEGKIPIAFLNRLTTERRVKVDEVTYVEFRGVLKDPVFRGMSTTIFSIPFSRTTDAKVVFLFYLSTAYGTFPKGIKVSDQGAKISGMGTIGAVKRITDHDSAKTKEWLPGGKEGINS